MSEDRFDRLYEAHVRRIHRYCLFRLNSRPDAEDVTAEVFCKLLSHGDRIEEERVLAWLYTVARNVCTNALKRRALARELPEPVERQAPEPWTDPEVWRCVACLRPRQQQAVYLHAVEDLPFVRVAELLGVTEPAAKMLYQRGIRKLRGLLGAEVRDVSTG